MFLQQIEEYQQQLVISWYIKPGSDGGELVITETNGVI
jgi:hypothetical protein